MSKRRLAVILMLVALCAFGPHIILILLVR